MSSGSRSTGCMMTYHEPYFISLLMQTGVDVTEAVGVSDDFAEIMWDLA